ncbi:hypothetical protein JTB14_001439 [Gonioctena quinquepunctata]|nr:hypothetical protein JTB14_001439 [Gonioctena quinquepunctata]
MEFLLMSYIQHLGPQAQCTKRNILSELAWYLIHGFLSPVTLFPKKLIQHLWTLRIGWDVHLHRFVATWTRFKPELPSISTISVPRHAFHHSAATSVPSMDLQMR